MPLSIVGARVVDVDSGRLGEPSTIAIEGERIAAIEPVGGAEPFGDREPFAELEPSAVDGRGLFLLPGLIDAHVHAVWAGGPDPVGAYRSMDRDELVHVASENAQVALGVGITTVRDLGGPLDVLDEVGWTSNGADIVYAGAPITRVGGHIGLFGGEVATVDQARAVAERQLDAGARAVKVVVSGGGLTPGTRPSEAELPIEVVRAVVEVARAHGIAVAAHCHATAAMRIALEAGVSTIEHASFLDPDGTVRFDPELALELRDRGVAVVPTAAGALRSAARYRVAGAHNPADTNAIARLEARRTIADQLHALGVQIVAGTDAGVTGTPFDSLHEELALYVDVGFTPADAIRAATAAAATYLGLDDRGAVTVGKRADLVLLDANPFEDIAVLRSPVAIFAAGRVVRSNRRSALLP